MEEIKDLKRYEVLESDVGVYFLYKGDEIVYVGQSICVWRRINTHIQEGFKDFDSYSVLPCDEDKLQETEMFYIFALQPKYNKMIEGFCNRNTFIKKIKGMFNAPLKRRDINRAIKESGVESYSFKGIEYFRSAKYTSVARYMIHAARSKEAIKSRLDII